MRGSVVKHGNGYSVVVELDRDRLARNPADTADPPRAPGKHAAMVTWDATETARFLTAVQDDRLYAAFLLLATTGARRGEVLGLCWSDVDLGTGRAAIRQTVITVNNEAQIGEPKTARGRRTIDLDAATVAGLKEHRKRQAQERLLVGQGGVTSGWCSAASTEACCAQDISPAHSLATSAGSGYVRSRYMVSAMGGRLWRWRPGSIRRWCRNASVTPISASRWTLTATSRRAFTPGPRSRSPR